MPAPRLTLTLAAAAWLPALAAAAPPSLSMAGTQRQLSRSPTPLALSRQGASEAEIRQEVIRRLEARIEARRRARREAAAGTDGPVAGGFDPGPRTTSRSALPSADAASPPRRAAAPSAPPVAPPAWGRAGSPAPGAASPAYSGAIDPAAQVDTPGFTRSVQIPLSGAPPAARLPAAPPRRPVAAPRLHEAPAPGGAIRDLDALEGRARGLARGMDLGGGDFPPEETPSLEHSVRASPSARGAAAGDGFISPDAVRRSLPWGPPETLPGREEGIMPPEVTGESTPTSAPPPRAALAPAAPAAPEEGETPAPAEPAGPREHVLKAGESLWALSRRYGVSVDALIRYNAVTSVDDLAIGAKIYIPDDEASEPYRPVDLSSPPPPPAAAAPRPLERPPVPLPPEAPGSYRVVKGDTLYKIARSHHVTVDEVLRVNPQISASHLAPGMLVVIPGRGSPRVAAAPRPAGPGAAAPAGSAEPAPPRPATPRPAPGPRVMPKPMGDGDTPYLEWPVSGTVTANFGWKDGKPHTGIDISAPLGTVVRAAAAGRVIFSGQMRGYGNVVILDHQNGFFTVYGNNQKNAVAKGGSANPVRVARGQAIAKVGATGDAVAPQLHFEVRKSNQAIDPFRYLAPRGARAARP